MNLSNIKAGQTFRSYKQLCETLEVKTLTGDKKKEQLQDWLRYFDYIRDGNKITIKHVYNSPLPINCNKTKYKIFIGKLIAKLALEKEQGCEIAILTKNEILNELIRINTTYINEKYKQIQLNQEHKNMTFEDVQYIYTTLNIEQMPEKGLDDLKGRALCYWEKDFNNNEYEIIYTTEHLQEHMQNTNFEPYNHENIFTYSFDPDTKIIGVYVIINTITGDMYIGSSVNINNRLLQHIEALKTGTHHNYKLQNAFDIYGYENFKFEILETVNDTSQLPFREYHYISLYHPKIYNISNPLSEYEIINKRNNNKQI
jgi:hypothetical protein